MWEIYCWLLCLFYFSYVFWKIKYYVTLFNIWDKRKGNEFWIGRGEDFFWGGLSYILDFSRNRIGLKRFFWEIRGFFGYIGGWVLGVRWLVRCYVRDVLNRCMVNDLEKRNIFWYLVLGFCFLFCSIFMLFSFL